MCTSCQMAMMFRSAEGDRAEQAGLRITWLQSVGAGLQNLSRMGWNCPKVVCTICFEALPVEEKASMRRV